MITLLTLISNTQIPFIIREDQLQSAQETKGQYNGLIYNTNDPSNLRRTRINKSKLDTIRIVSKDILNITIEVWTLNSNIEQSKQLLLDEFELILNQHVADIETWKQLFEIRKQHVQ